MCGIAGIFGTGASVAGLQAMMLAQRHRGPDDEGVYFDQHTPAGLAHNRLSIIDLSAAGHQPMSRGHLHLVFNGEIYNYLELRQQLGDGSFQSRTDSEVILAAYERWGEACLDRFIGMFSFLIWDDVNRRLFACRDRFGVKPLYYSHSSDGTLYVASEIRALHAAGIPAVENEAVWATYFSFGLHDHSEQTFWSSISSLPPGSSLTWNDSKIQIRRWYDLADRVPPEFDQRQVQIVREEYLALLLESIKLRFRADVPVGINISGGLDSSALLALVRATQGPESNVKAFTYITGDPNYDELPWVEKMLERTSHPCVVSRLSAEDVPSLAQSVQSHQSEPFGGMPTLAYAKLFDCARTEGVIVVLDGQGMDEQWAGYDYYAKASLSSAEAPVQGTRNPQLRPGCLTQQFRSCAIAFEPPATFGDSIRNRQYLDTRFTKIPRALRFNDRISMRSSMELREPFLDHRLFELALRQPADRKLRNGTHKWLLRDITRQLVPFEIAEAPKRPLQTPQREWLRGPLKTWAEDCIEAGLNRYGGQWLEPTLVRKEWSAYCRGESDNSFYVWQWISLGLMVSDSHGTSRISADASRSERFACDATVPA